MLKIEAFAAKIFFFFFLSFQTCDWDAQLSAPQSSLLQAAKWTGVFADGCCSCSHDALLCAHAEIASVQQVVSPVNATYSSEWGGTANIPQINAMHVLAMHWCGNYGVKTDSEEASHHHLTAC